MPIPVYLTYPDTRLQLDSVVKVVVDDLEKVGSPCGYYVAIVTIALMVETRPTSMSAVEHANWCLSNTQATHHSDRLGAHAWQVGVCRCE